MDGGGAKLVYEPIRKQDLDANDRSLLTHHAKVHLVRMGVGEEEFADSQDGILFKHLELRV